MSKTIPTLMRFLLSLVLAALVGCDSDRGGPDWQKGKLRIYASLLPQAGFVERIGGEHVDVRVLVGPGENPHTFTLSPRQRAGLETADVFFTAGMPFEEVLVAKLPDDGPKIVDTSRGIRRLRPSGHGEHHDPSTGSHDHHDHEDSRHGDHEDAHHHGEMDPHTWMSPVLAKRHVAAIAETLIELDPARAEAYRENLAAFQAELDRLHADVREALQPLRGRTLLVYHPAFGYFAREYGLRQVAVESQGLSDQGSRHLAELIQQARAEGTRVLFVQPQLGQSTVESIRRQLNVAVVRVDPLAKDYVANLRNVARAVREALGSQQPATDPNSR